VKKSLLEREVELEEWEILKKSYQSKASGVDIVLVGKLLWIY
jgi:hypothetical protein